MRNPLLDTLRAFALPLTLHFSKPSMPAQTYTPPPPAPTPPPAPPAPKAATSIVRDSLPTIVPKRGRRSTILTSGMTTTDSTDGRGRTLLGSPLTAK